MNIIKWILKKICRKKKIHTEICNLTCCICFEHFNEKNHHVLPCKHIFHNTCIVLWIEKYNIKKYPPKANIPIKGKCPICRQESYSIICRK